MSCEAVIAIIYGMETLYSVILSITTYVRQLTTSKNLIISKQNVVILRAHGDM